MRRLWVISGVALLAGAPYFLFSQTSTTTSTTTTPTTTTQATPPKPKKKKTVKRKAVASKPVPKTPPVSVAARTQASEDVTGILERTADMPLENPAAMVPFFEQLRRVLSGEAKVPLSILHYGDSHT